ncbi:hypothetical protein SNE40_015453 [Patella caerulea]|uniref:Uncharacterized protein n=1 Tax=Patella caerulea TaxID=87958 RepID=A0AAN8JFQ6_PATCE
MYKIKQILTVFLVLVLTVVCAQEKELDECSRGLRRAHPTQENGYQIFVRSGRHSQWLDRQCPQYEIYEQRVCGCLEPDNSPVELPQPRQDNSFQAENGNQDQEVAVIPDADGNCAFHRNSNYDPSKYERFSENGWVEEDCNWPFYTGLIWDQENCRCEWGPNPSFPKLVDSDVVFVPAPCLLMLNMTFDDAIKDEGRDLWLKRNTKDSTAIVSDPGAIGRAGRFQGDNSNIAVPFFKGNSFGTLFKMAYRFKLCDDQQEFKIDKACDGSSSTPFVFTFTGWDSKFTVAMETMNTIGPIVEECFVPQSNDGWNNVVMIYQDNFLEVRINDQPCISSEKYSGEVKTSECPVNFPGDTFCGMMDEFYITRGCRY